MTIFHHFPIVFVCVCSMKQPRTTNRHPRHRLERGGHNSAPEAHELPADDGSQGDDVPGVPQKGSMGSAHPKLVGGFNHEFYFPFHIWDVILAIDELHHFSRWLLHHQPARLSFLSSFRIFRMSGSPGILCMGPWQRSGMATTVGTLIRDRISWSGLSVRKRCDNGGSLNVTGCDNGEAKKLNKQIYGETN